jgi:hypothetical protein
MVAGTRPILTAAQVARHMGEVYRLGVNDVEVHLFPPADFLLVFLRRIDVDKVLHGDPPADAPFRLSFLRWHPEARAASAPLCFKVLLDLRGIPAHLWGVETARCVVRSSSLITQVAPASISRRDMRTFTVVAWCIDLDLIPDQVVLVVPETEAPYVEQGLFP